MHSISKKEGTVSYAFGGTILHHILNEHLSCLRPFWAVTFASICALLYFPFGGIIGVFLQNMFVRMYEGALNFGCTVVIT